MIHDTENDHSDEDQCWWCYWTDNYANGVMVNYDAGMMTLMIEEHDDDKYDMMQMVYASKSETKNNLWCNIIIIIKRMA